MLQISNSYNHLQTKGLLGAINGNQEQPKINI